MHVFQTLSISTSHSLVTLGFLYFGYLSKHFPSHSFPSLLLLLSFSFPSLFNSFALYILSLSAMVSIHEILFLLTLLVHTFCSYHLPTFLYPFCNCPFICITCSNWSLFLLCSSKSPPSFCFPIPFFYSISLFPISLPSSLLSSLLFPSPLSFIPIYCIYPFHINFLGSTYIRANTNTV